MDSHPTGITHEHGIDLQQPKVSFRELQKIHAADVSACEICHPVEGGKW